MDQILINVLLAVQQSTEPILLENVYVIHLLQMAVKNYVMDVIILGFFTIYKLNKLSKSAACSVGTSLDTECTSCEATNFRS